MRTIITDDILNECENIILLFSDIEFIRSRIVVSYPNLSDNKKKSVSTRIKSYINQGLRFLQETDDNIFTAPLTLFYSINNFAKAVYLTNLPNLSISNSHGIELDKSISVDKCKSLSDLSISVGSKGAFKNLLDVTKDDISTSDIINLKDVLSIIPELIELYSMRYMDEANAFLLHKDDKYKYKAYLHKGTKDSFITRDFSLLSANSCHLNFYNDESFVVFYDETITDEKKDNIIYRDVYGNEFLTCGVSINGKNIKISRLACLYICFYTFSMLVRYYPETWISICDSADITIIRKLLIHCKKEMLLDIIQLLLNDKYCFVTKLSQEAHVFDNKEIYKMIKKESLMEYKRTGRSPFLF